MLEQRLQAFINESLLKDGRTVDADTRLFEDGYIDSIRVLELIAFVEQAIGRKVPDRLVRLSTFRSVRAIAATFGNGAAPDASDAERLHEYPAAHPDAKSPIPELLARNELHVLDDGRVTLSGTALALHDFFDAAIDRWATALGVTTRDVPSRIPLATLDRAGFRTAFPHLLVHDDGEQALTPAVCYHCYPEQSGQVLNGDSVTSVRATCWRNEAETMPLLRQRAFTMREFVFLGTRRSVEHARLRLVATVGDFVRELALDGFVEAASDPFFTDASEGRRLAQRAGALKLELRLTLEGGHSVAVASFNHHHGFFGKRFAISLADGAVAHSGCVAFGLERWVLAFLTQHGFDQSGWPDSARRGVSAGRANAGSA